MIMAWRRADGRYRLTADTKSEERRAATRLHLRFGEGYSVRDDQLEELEAEKVFGVITGPTPCGHEVARFQWLPEHVALGRTEFSTRCESCSRAARERHSLPVSVYHHLDIIEVLGEADVAEEVYRAEFAAKLEAMT